LRLIVVVCNKTDSKFHHETSVENSQQNSTEARRQERRTKTVLLVSIMYRTDEYRLLTQKYWLEHGY
jgi:hypothetical protein